MSGERRGVARCPECQGPAVADEKYPEGLRCRNSICIHNHSDVTCPRCGNQDLDSVTYQEGNYRYNCRECLNVWMAESA